MRKQITLVPRHKFHTRRNLDPDQVRSGLSRLSNKHAASRREGMCGRATGTSSIPTSAGRSPAYA